VKPSDTPETLYCTYHPNVETLLRCNRCGKPICTRCAIRTPVGYRCKECVRGQQAVFYSATTADYLVAAGVTLALTLPAGFVVPLLFGLLPLGYWGALIMFFVAPAVAGAMAEVVRRSVGRRRGRYLRYVVPGVGIAGSGVGFLILWLFVGLAGGALSFLVYIVMLAATLYARLR